MKLNVLTHKPYLCSAILVLVMLLSACARGLTINQAQAQSEPPPTVAPIFQAPSFVAPTLVPLPNPTPPPQVVRTAGEQVDFVEVTIFDDVLAPDWTVEHSSGMNYDLGFPGYFNSGRASIEVLPLYPEADFRFAVHPAARTIYPRNQVMGFRFWLSGGSNHIETGDLAVTISGSNEFPYWIENDHSVARAIGARPDEVVFWPTRLYYLEINRSIPPDTWVEVTVLLDNLVYDPPYEFVTGMSISNDTGFFGKFYVDQVEVVLLP